MFLLLVRFIYALFLSVTTLLSFCMFDKIPSLLDHRNRQSFHRLGYATLSYSHLTTLVCFLPRFQSTPFHKIGRCDTVCVFKPLLPRNHGVKVSTPRTGEVARCATDVQESGTVSDLYVAWQTTCSLLCSTNFAQMLPFS